MKTFDESDVFQSYEDRWSSISMSMENHDMERGQKYAHAPFDVIFHCRNGQSAASVKSPFIQVNY